MRDVVKVNGYTQKYDIFKQSLDIGLLYPYNKFCVVGNLPSKISLENNKLHCNKSAAIEYEDGFKLWYLNGVCVPQWLVETQWDKIDCSLFSKINNAEVRREFVRKIGVERILVQLGGEKIDQVGDYELVIVDLKGETGKWPYLKMRNPSIQTWHLECVSKECKTVMQAINFRASQLKNIGNNNWSPEVLT